MQTDEQSRQFTEAQKARIVDQDDEAFARAVVAAVDPHLKVLAAKAWARHPNNPAVQARNLFAGIAAAAARARIVELGGRAEAALLDYDTYAYDVRPEMATEAAFAQAEVYFCSAEAFRIAREAPICGSTGATCEHCDDCPEART